MNRSIFLILPLAGLSAGVPEPAKLECPQQKSSATNRALKETAAAVGTIKQRLRDRAYGNAVPEIKFNLRKKYPKASSAEILNYLITAYCPVGAAQGEPVDEAKARIGNL